MKLIPFTILLTAVFTPASSVLVTYDTVYDESEISLNVVACSDGKNGLITKGYSTFGSLPAFPKIGGAAAVEGYNSISCGSCWNLSYTKDDKTTSSIYVIAIDHADEGFNIAGKAMVILGGQEAVTAGKIDASAALVQGSYCGF
jgi:hypothetical protein